MSKQRSRFLDLLAEKCSVMAGLTIDRVTGARVPIGEAIMAAHAAMEANREDPEKRKAIINLYQKALEDPNTAQELAELRVETVGNYLWPSLNFGQFFELVPLRNEEQALLRVETKVNVGIVTIGQKNKPRRNEVEPDTSETLIQMIKITTDRVKYNTMDIERGDISEVSRKLFDLAFDLKVELEVRSKAVLTAGAYGAFTTTGKNSARSYLKHPNILPEHLPTTNDVIVGVPAESTKFGLAVLQAIVKYASQWGDGWSDGELKPTGDIIVPAIDVHDMGDGLGTSTVSNQLTDQLMQLGYFGFSWLNVNWRFRPDATIPIGTCYPLFNKKIGKLFHKPGMAKSYVKDDDIKDEREEWQTWVGNWALVEQQRVNTARFTYKTS